MEPSAIIAKAKDGMHKAVEFTQHEFSGIHTGKASPSMVDGVTVDAYGSSVKLRDIAAITTPDSRMIVIQPWDQGVIKDIEKAIIAANLGFNPSAMGTTIRVPVPELTKERRQDLVKVAHNIAEEGRVRVRQVRRDANEALKSAEKAKSISEDELKRYEKEVQKMTDEANDTIAESLKKKEKDLTTV